MKKVMHITFRNGESFDLPCQVIAESRARYYAVKDPDTTYEAELAYTLSSDSELRDWVFNNMNVKDFAGHLVRTSQPQPMDFNEGWNDSDFTTTDIEEMP